MFDENRDGFRLPGVPAESIIYKNIHLYREISLGEKYLIQERLSKGKCLQLYEGVKDMLRAAGYAGVAVDFNYLI